MTPEKHRAEALAVFYDNCRSMGELRSARKACERLKDVDPAEFIRLHNLAESATFERRQYGGGKMYCWAKVPGIKIMDPWPATVYPAPALIVQLMVAQLVEA